MKKKMIVCMSCDDVHPENGFGLDIENDLKYLILLNKKLGCKFTLFIPANYYECFNLSNYKSWVEHLKKLNMFEFALHGLTHNDPIRQTAMEFANYDIDEFSTKLEGCQSIFQNVDIKPSGIKPPGWFIKNEQINQLQSLKYIVTNTKGTKLSKLENLTSIPVTFSIHEQYEIQGDEDCLFIHSHIFDPCGITSNIFNKTNYNNILTFFKKYENQYDFSFKTIDEYIKEQKGD